MCCKIQFPTDMAGQESAALSENLFESHLLEQDCDKDGNPVSPRPPASKRRRSSCAGDSTTAAVPLLLPRPFPVEGLHLLCP